LAGLLVVGALLLVGCASRVPPIETGVIERTLPDGPVRGLWAKVHLDRPGVQILVTSPLKPDPANPPGTEARLFTVAKWAETEHTTLAVNANFFAGVEKPAPGEKDPGWFANRPVDLRGASVSDGVVVSPAREVNGVGDPAVVFTRDHRAKVVAATARDLAGAVAAVAGIGPPDSGKAPGTFLVTAGRNTGATAQVQPAVRHPRTAAGVTADGRTLILVVIDGRQPGHSIGVTLPELAELMIGLGAVDAVNLDGGGSSTFIYRRADGSLLTNQAPGGTWRPVGNHLGVRVEKL
jgi:exopolysaccharide biosynthesis protein